MKTIVISFKNSNICFAQRNGRKNVQIGLLADRSEPEVTMDKTSEID